MRVWVTGAAGFVGEAVVRRLAAQGHRVVAIARARSAHRVHRALADLVVTELPDLGPLDRLPDPDVIVHAAADLHRGNEASARAVHVEATRALVRRAPGAKLVHLSTTDVYAAFTSDRPIDESSPLGPRDVYGRTKLEGEGAAGDRAVVLRPPGIYGPWSRGDGVLEMIRKIAEGRFFHVGDGRARRSWVHVDTLVDAIVHAFDIAPGVYVVDDGAPISRGDLAATIARFLGRPARFPRISVPAGRLLARSLDALLPFPSPFSMASVHYRSEGFPLDTAKLKKTEFSAGRSIDEAIESTVRWARLTL